MEWYFFYNLEMQIKLCKIRYLNLGKTLLFPRNQAICMKNWKVRRTPISTKFNNFCWNFAYFSYLTMSTKMCSGFFKILFSSRVISKNVKTKCVEIIFFIFANNSIFKQNKKKSRTPFCTPFCRKRVGSFSKKYRTLC